MRWDDKDGRRVLTEHQEIDPATQLGPLATPKIAEEVAEQVRRSVV